MAKPAPAPSSPFLQLLNELQSSPSVTTLESWLTTNFPKSSAVAATLASIVTQALANNGTITFSTAQASVTLEPLCAAFGFTAPTLPSVLVGNISVGITSLTIDVNNPALEMVGSCTGILPASDPCVFFAAAIDDPESGWALVFGGDLETNFSNFPVIGSPGLSIPLDLAAAFLVVSTGGISDYSIPDQGNFFANYPITFTQAGVMIAALLDLTTNPGRTTCSTNLAYFNNPPQTPQSLPESGNILITADLNATVATLTAELGSRTLYNSVTLDLTLNLILAQTPTIQLTSSLAVGEINFNVNIDLNEETLLIDLMLQAGNGIELQLPSDQYFASDVYINSIQGLMGVDFDKCEAEVGIAAAFGFNTSPSGTPSSDLVTSLLPTNQQPVTGSVPAPSAWECALVVGLGADLVPDLDLALLSIDQISLAELCPLLCPLVPTSAAQALNGIYLSNVLLYWCDDLPGSFASLNLSLPGYGTALPTGFIFQGGLTWGSFSAFADITVDSKHCSGQLSLSPFSIGDILSISGDGPGWTSPDGSQTIGKGGPQVQFDTTADPDYLSATWNVQFLGLIEAELEVTLSSTELDLSISAQIGSLASGSFDCQLDPAGGWFNFSCSGKFDDSGDYGVGVNTGPYAETISLLDCEFSASLAVTVSDDDISWTVEGSLQYLGLTLQIPSYTGDFALATVDDILKAVWSAIVANVERVFENILNDIQALAKELGKDVLKLVDKVVDDIKAFYDWLTGHSDKPAWLQSGAMLMSQAGVYFQVSDYQGTKVQFVPDITEPYLQPKKVYQNMDPVIAGLPQDIMLPCVANGTVFQRRDDSNWFVVAWNYSKGPGSPLSPEIYPVENAGNFLQRCSGPVNVAWQVNPYSGGSQSAYTQINQVFSENKSLMGLGKNEGTGFIMSDAPAGINYRSISLFIDGIRYHIGPNLWYHLVTPSTPVTIPDETYSNLPQYQGLGDATSDFMIDVQQGNLYKSDNPAAPAIYYASTGSDGMSPGLYWINLSQWVTIWNRATPILIPDAFWQCLGLSQNNAYPGTNPPPTQMTWVHDGNGNGAWPSGNGYTVEYGVSFVTAAGESFTTWGTQLPVVGYMCAELNIPTDPTNKTIARNIYRQFLLNGISTGPRVLVGTINDNFTTVWSDTNAAYNVAPPANSVEAPEDWEINLSEATGPVWQQGNEVQYAVSFVLQAGETQLSPWSDPIAVEGYAYPAFDKVPTCPTDSQDPADIVYQDPLKPQNNPITRNIYRQCFNADGKLIDPQRLVGQIGDNTTTTFCDSVPAPDSSFYQPTGGAKYDLGSGGNGVWPAGQQGNSVQYGVSFVNGPIESTIAWGQPIGITGYMGIELVAIPTDGSNWATARNVYRQFLGSNGSNLAPAELVGTLNDNTTTGWNDFSPAYNVAAPRQLGPPNNGDWAANAPIANSEVWQVGNNVQYAMTYVLPGTYGGETQLSEWSAFIPVTLYAYPYFDSVPTCPTDPPADGSTILSVSPGQTIMRNLYRICTGPGGNVIQSQTFVGQISDNTTTFFRDWMP